MYWGDQNLQWVGWPDGYSTSQDVIHQRLPECVKKGVYVCVGNSPLFRIFFLSLHFFGGLNNCQDGNCRTFLKTVHLSHVWNIHFAFVGVGIMVLWSWTTLIQFAGMAGKRNGQCTSSQPITQSTSHTLIHWCRDCHARCWSDQNW